jgi:hypothetical protein
MEETMSLNSWKNTARQHTTRKPAQQQKKFGGNFFWKDSFKLNATPTPMLIIPGEYADLRDPDAPKTIYFKQNRHVVTLENNGRRQFKSFACSHGIEGYGDCYGCEMQYRNKDKRVASRSMYYFTTIILDWFYKVPALDAQGTQILSKKTGEPVWNLERPTLPKHKLEWSKKYERQFGRRQYLEMGSGHLSQLVSIDDTLNLSCTCGGNLMTTIYECNNCGTPIVDMQDFEGSESDLKNLVSRPHTCPACDHVDFLMNKLSCDSCDEPTPLTITSAVLYLQKTGENTSSTLSVARFQQLRDFVVPLDNQPLVGDDLSGIHSGLSALTEPYNFPQMFQGELDRDFQISQFG